MTQNAAKVHLTLRIEQNVERKLKEIAEKNERTISAEVRLAIRNHLDADALQAERAA